MNTKVLGGVIVILLIIIGLVFFSKGSQQRAEELPTNTNATSTQPMVEEGIIIGKWQSVDDSKFTREFSITGQMTDMYEGSAPATVTGEWSFVSNPVELQDFPIIENSRVLRVFTGTDVLYFAVSPESTDNKLVLINLTGNGTLTFDKISG